MEVCDNNRIKNSAYDKYLSTVRWGTAIIFALVVLLIVIFLAMGYYFIAALFGTIVGIFLPLLLMPLQKGVNTLPPMWICYNGEYITFKFRHSEKKVKINSITYVHAIRSRKDWIIVKISTSSKESFEIIVDRKTYEFLDKCIFEKMN